MCLCVSRGFDSDKRLLPMSLHIITDWRLTVTNNKMCVQFKCRCTCLQSRYPREFSRLCKLHPQYRNTLSVVSSPQFSFSAFRCSYGLSLKFRCFYSTKYPPLLDRQRQYGMRSLRHFHTWPALGHFELQVQCPIHLATCSPGHAPMVKLIMTWWGRNMKELTKISQKFHRNFNAFSMFEHWWNLNETMKFT